MSNPERHPDEVTCASGTDEPGTVRLLTAREVPLGGPRAMAVRRSLPQRERSLIGAWCFVDHYGPDDVSVTGGMSVPGHPHTGLQTVSWLFSGEVEHRDTTGAHAIVRPGELNLMTAGSGIAHSEFSTPTTATLHGVQLWVALPEAHRSVAPRFEHHVPEPVEVGDATLRVFLGSLAGVTSPVPTHSPLLGAELALPAGTSVTLDVDPRFEHGVLGDTGLVSVGSETAKPGEILYAAPGVTRLTIEAGADEPARMLLLGGEPFGERIVMWWNFVGRSHEEVVAFREAWQRERSTTDRYAAASPGDGRRYGAFPVEWGEDTLPAPTLPNLRLRPRG